MSNLFVIILVYGFWGGVVYWSKVIFELKCFGYDNLYVVELLLILLVDDVEWMCKMIVQ